MAFKLLIEKPDPSEFEYIVEEKNAQSGERLYIKGPYMMASEVNKNKRVYELESMVTEVARYEKEMIKQDRAMGELNHPTTADVVAQTYAVKFVYVKNVGDNAAKMALDGSNYDIIIPAGGSVSFRGTSNLTMQNVKVQRVSSDTEIEYIIAK